MIVNLTTNNYIRLGVSAHERTCCGLTKIGFSEHPHRHPAIGEPVSIAG